MSSSKIIVIPLVSPTEDAILRDRLIKRVLALLNTHKEIYIKFPSNPRVPECLYTKYSMEWESVLKSIDNLTCLVGRHMIQIKKSKKIINPISFLPDEFLRILSKYVPTDQSKIDHLVFVSIYEPDESVYFYLDGDSIVELSGCTRYPIQTYINNIILHSDYITISDRYTVMRDGGRSTVVQISLLKDTLKYDSDARDEIISGLEDVKIV